MVSFDNSRDETTRTVLFLLAISLNAFEMVIPRIPLFPWLKPGLANVVTAVWIIRYGTLDTLLYSLLRVWISGFYFGFSFVTIALATSGALAATLTMGLLWALFGRRGWLGTIGLCIAGAAAHNAGQLGAVYAIMARNSFIFYQIPAMLVASVVSGVVVGFMVPAVANLRIPHALASSPSTEKRTSPLRHPSALRTSGALFFFLFCMALAGVRDYPVLLVCAGAATAAAFVIQRFSIGQLFRPILRFPLLFVFVGAVHLAFTPGHSVWGIGWLTREGITECTIQWLRLWTWLQGMPILRRLGFDQLVIAALRRLFPGRTATIAAGLRALELFPAAIALARENTPQFFRDCATSPRKAVEKLIERFSVLADS